MASAAVRALLVEGFDVVCDFSEIDDKCEDFDCNWITGEEGEGLGLLCETKLPRGTGTAGLVGIDVGWNAWEKCILTALILLLMCLWACSNEHLLSVWYLIMSFFSINFGQLLWYDGFDVDLQFTQ